MQPQRAKIEVLIKFIEAMKPGEFFDMPGKEMACRNRLWKLKKHFEERGTLLQSEKLPDGLRIWKF